MSDGDVLLLLLDWLGRPEKPDELDVLQQGRVTRAPAPGLSTADRFEPFDARRVRSGDLILERDGAFVHARRKYGAGVDAGSLDPIGSRA